MDTVLQDKEFEVLNSGFDGSLLHFALESGDERDSRTSSQNSDGICSPSSLKQSFLSE